MARFPEPAWLQALSDKLNTDEQYARIAHKWEGDLILVIEPEGGLSEQVVLYLDLWHGKCRQANIVAGPSAIQAAFTLNGPYRHYVRLLKGEMDPMQALLTRKLGVKGNMAVLMRSVPTVLDFVRCAREVTDDFVG